MVSGALLAFGHFRMDSTLRGRGKARISPFRRMSSGITPACTWKRQTGVRNASHSRDHPPRVRGKAAVRAGNRARAGITPACAGKAQDTTGSTKPQGITPAYARKRLKKSKKINDPSPLAHRISFSFSYTANVRRQSVSARCAPETSRPKYAASVVSL